MSSRRVTSALAVAVVTAAGLGLAPPAAAAARTWSLDTVVRPSSTVQSADLLDSSAISGSNVWAVGYATVNTKAVYAPIVRHWTGSAWRRVTPPVLRVAKHPRFTGVTATSSGVWVVGSGKFGSRRYFNSFVSHRVGDHWVSYDLGAGVDLADVRVFGARDVWVLASRTSGSQVVGIAKHWNGRTWTTSRLPAVPTGPGDGNWQIATDAKTHAARLLHWNGRSWALFARPRVTGAPATPYYRSLVVKDGSLFVVVSFGLGENGRAGMMLFEYRNGTWHKRLSLPKEYTDDITRTSATGVWLLSSKQAYPRLLHVVGGRVVSVATPPAVRDRPVYLFSVTGTATSSTVFGVGEVNADGFDAALAARYRP